MATVEIGTKSESWKPFIQDTGYLVTSFNVDDWSGNTDPQSGRKLFVVYQQSIYAKYYDSSGNLKVNVICGTSAGDTSKADVYAGILVNNYITYPATTNYALGTGTTYYAGLRTQSSSGAYSTRTNETSTGSKVYQNTTTSNGQQWVQFVYYGLPNKIASIAAETTGPTSVSVTFSQGTAPETAGNPTSYKIQYKAASSATWLDYETVSGYPANVAVSGLSESTSYNFRVAGINGISSFVSSATGPWSNTATATTTNSVQVPTWSGSYSSGQEDSYYSSYATATNADSVSLLSGSLPPGVIGNFSTSTDRYTISGTPTTPGTYTFSLRATNAGGNSDSSFSIFVSTIPAPAWIDQTLKLDPIVGESYNDSVSASNADGYNIGGVIPPGLSFNSGNLSGTLSTAGTYTFTITAYNANGSTNKTFSMVVDTVILTGGARMTGSTSSTKLTKYNRYDGSNWVELTVAKRYDGDTLQWIDI